MTRLTPQSRNSSEPTAPLGIAPTRHHYGYRLSFLLMLWGTAAHAAPLSLELTVERTPSAQDCADREGLFARVQKYSQRTSVTAQPSNDSVRVKARFDKRDGAYVAELDFSGVKPGERTFSDRSTRCGSLEEAVAVAIVLLLDSETELREKPQAKVEPPKASLRLLGGSVRVPEQTPLVRMGLVSFGAGPLWGFSRATSVWYSAAFAAEFPGRLQLGLGAVGLGPTRVGFENGTVDVSLLALELKGCKSWGKSWWFGVCAAPALGRLHGRGNGFDEGLVANMVWFAWETSVVFLVPLGAHWFAGAEGLTWIPLSKQTLSVENAGTAWNPSSVWGGLGLRLGVRFD